MAGTYDQGVRRTGRRVGVVLLLLGLFWSGRESSHGLGAFWEHWWCPIPLLAILMGLVAVVTPDRRPT